MPGNSLVKFGNAEVGETAFLRVVNIWFGDRMKLPIRLHFDIAGLAMTVSIGKILQGKIQRATELWNFAFDTLLLVWDVCATTELAIRICKLALNLCCAFFDWFLSGVQRTVEGEETLELVNLQVLQ